MGKFNLMQKLTKNSDKSSFLQSQKLQQEKSHAKLERLRQDRYRATLAKNKRKVRLTLVVQWLGLILQIENFDSIQILGVGWKE